MSERVWWRPPTISTSNKLCQSFLLFSKQALQFTINIIIQSRSFFFFSKPVLLSQSISTINLELSFLSTTFTINIKINIQSVAGILVSPRLLLSLFNIYIISQSWTSLLHHCAFFSRFNINIHFAFFFPTKKYGTRTFLSTKKFVAHALFFFQQKNLWQTHFIATFFLQEKICQAIFNLEVKTTYKILTRHISARKFYDTKNSYSDLNKRIWLEGEVARYLSKILDLRLDPDKAVKHLSNTNIWFCFEQLSFCLGQN